MKINRNGHRYTGHNFRKFYTVTDTSTGELFVALCNALDKSIYKRLRELIEADIKANQRIIGTLPEERVRELINSGKLEEPEDTETDTDTEQGKSDKPSIPFLW